jgi:hypothetical protein
LCSNVYFYQPAEFDHRILLLINARFISSCVGSKSICKREDIVKSMLQAFISYDLDYFNALYFAPPARRIVQPQLI